MSEVLMFNPVDGAYFFISASSKQDIDKMRENGFVLNPRLVAMYHDGLKKHVMVQTQDVKRWEEKGYFAEPTMIYHPKEPTQMVSSADAKKACNNGWYLSPAQFPGNSEGKLKTLTLKEASNG